MNVRLAVASAYVPGIVKRRAIEELLRRSADAFGVPAPDVAGKPYRERLRVFAAFTAEQAEAVYRADLGLRSDAPTTAVRARLRAGTFAMGRRIARLLGIRTRAEAMKAARVIYRLLGVDFEGRADGSIVISSCQFSRAYTRRACAVVSGLDEGLLAGLAGGGQLEFSSRITEGCARCEAQFHFDAVQGTGDGPR